MAERATEIRKRVGSLTERVDGEIARITANSVEVIMHSGSSAEQLEEGSAFRQDVGALIMFQRGLLAAIGQAGSTLSLPSGRRLDLILEKTTEGGK